MSTAVVDHRFNEGEDKVATSTRHIIQPTLFTLRRMVMV
jgi:hypothetical protein